MNATQNFEITQQALDAGTIVHTGWTLGRDTAEQCGVNVADYFDASGNYLGADENGLAPVFEQAPFCVRWEFMGTATQEHFDAAQAVADAMEILGTTETTLDVLDSAMHRLRKGWSPQAVLAVVANCSFEVTSC